MKFSHEYIRLLATIQLSHQIGLFRWIKLNNNTKNNWINSFVVGYFTGKKVGVQEGIIHYASKLEELLKNATFIDPLEK